MEMSMRRHSPLVGAFKLPVLSMLVLAALAACGGGGGTDTSQVTVSGPVAPQISAQPQSATVNSGQTATFSVTASGTTPMTYQWMKNSSNVSGATAASYTTPATSSSDNGAAFTVMVANSAGNVTSSAATLTVNSGSGAVAPQITAQPQNAAVNVGQTATFSVTATGTAPLSYQWMKNSTAISGATSASYTTPATVAGDSGAAFTVNVSNSAGGVTSNAATLTVSGGSLTSQTITFNNPGTQTVGTPLTLAATASSGLTVSFASQTTSVCTVSGTAATFLVAGTCTIQATQAGNGTYAAATPVAQSFTVKAAALPPAATPTFSVAGGVYTSPQSVTLACSTASSTIYYTTNATTPTTASSVYSSAIAVSSTETIEAICAAAGYSNSAVASATYTINASGTYALPTNRVTTWQPGVSYAPTSGSYVPAQPPSGWTGGIPARTTNCATLSPSGSDDTAAINNAIAACPANQTVQLTSGKFVISGNGIVIKNSYVTLRGSGPGPGMLGIALGTFPIASSATLLVKSDGKANAAPVITVGSLPNLNTMWQTAAFAADAAQGANSVTLTSSPPSGLSAGEIVYVDETYDSSLTWYDTYYGDQGSGGGYDGWGEGEYGVAVAQSRPIGQAMEVASVSGNTVTFTTPFHQTYRVSHSAHLGRVQVTAKTAWVGIESLFVTGGDGGDNGGNVVFGTASYSWAKNIESAGHGPNYGGALVHFLASFRCELRDSYLHSNLADIPNISPGGAFYNIVLDSYAADNLVENNISWIANKVMVMRGTGGGNVIGYNYMDDGYGQSYPNQGEAGLNADHMTTSHHELFEGNYSWSMSTDSRWGNAIYITWFRNRTTAQRISAWPGILPTSTAFGNPLTTFVYNGGGSFFYEDEYNRMMVDVGSHHWWFNYVGNVLGAPSLPLLTTPRSYYKVPQTGYDYQWAGSSIPASIDTSRVPIWVLGTPDGAEPAFSGNGLDPSVLPVTLRDANFDYYTGAVYWHGIGGSSQSQTTPPGAGGAAALPPSLYLPGKPAFFGSGTWPWVDGSNASNPVPGSLPAYTRFNLGTPNATN
jgi:hypothetical protein